MVPEAWQNDKTMSKEKRAFYKWSAFAMEPWDGPGKLNSKYLLSPAYSTRISHLSCSEFLLNPSLTYNKIYDDVYNFGNVAQLN